MRQQINLYQEVLIDRPEPLAVRQFVVLLAAFAVLLVLLGLGVFWQLKTEEGRLLALQQQQAELASLVAALEKEHPERVKSVLLEEQLADAKSALAGQKKVLAYFTEQDSTTGVEVVRTLEGLAAHRSPGVWLSRVQLDVAGDNIALAGSALRPEQVPQYLKFLGDEQVLAGRVFSRLSLTRLQERPGQVDFNLESAREAQ